MYLEMDYNKLSEIFVNNLLETNRGFDFYVNWENAKAYKEFEIELNAMNVLIRADNIKEKFYKLIELHYIHLLQKTIKDCYFVTNMV